MIYTKLSFLNQPSNLQTLVFTLSFDIPLIQIYTAVFVTGIPLAGQIKIGANLAETISNTKTYLETNYPTPVVDYNISSNEILITPTSSAFSLSSFTNIASVLTISEETTIMKKIFIRSPYFIQIDEAGQVGSKVELFFYNKGTSVPATATYTLSKKIASATQTNNIYNISNYAKEFIKPISTTSVSIPTEEDVSCWCYVDVKRYEETSAGSYTLLDTETFVCLNGYTQYSGGYNQDSTNEVISLFNEDIKLYRSGDINVSVWIDSSVSALTYTWEKGILSYDIDINTDGGVWNLPVLQDGTFSLNRASTVYFEATFEQLCEPKYTPVVCTFINRYGGWQYLTFFKAKMESIDTTSKDFNLLPSSVDYNVLQGQRKQFNQQGKKKVKCNTGWVNENYSELIQDLLLSEVILLDDKPVVVKTQSFDIKTSLKDKNINYEIEFEYNYGLINDVI